MPTSSQTCARGCPPGANSRRMTRPGRTLRRPGNNCKGEKICSIAFMWRKITCDQLYPPLSFCLNPVSVDRFRNGASACAAASARDAADNARSLFQRMVNERHADGGTDEALDGRGKSADR